MLHDLIVTASALYNRNETLINILCLIGGVIAAIRLFFFLRGREKMGMRLLMSLDEFWSWLPGFDTVREYKNAEEKHKAFLLRRKNRKPGHLTDEM